MSDGREVGSPTSWRGGERHPQEHQETLNSRAWSSDVDALQDELDIAHARIKQMERKYRLKEAECAEANARISKLEAERDTGSNITPDRLGSYEATESSTDSGVLIVDSSEGVRSHDSKKDREVLTNRLRGRRNRDGATGHIVYSRPYMENSSHIGERITLVRTVRGTVSHTRNSSHVGFSIPAGRDSGYSNIGSHSPTAQSLDDRAQIERSPASSETKVAKDEYFPATGVLAQDDYDGYALHQQPEEAAMSGANTTQPLRSTNKNQTTNLPQFPWAITRASSDVMEDLLKTASESGSTETHTEQALSWLLQLCWKKLKLDTDVAMLLEFISAFQIPVSSGANCLPSSWKVYIRCQWEIPAVLEEMGLNLSDTLEQLRNELQKKLESFIILTGTDDAFECSTCGDFLMKRWGKTGLAMIRAVCHSLGAQFLKKANDQNYIEKTGLRVLQTTQNSIIVHRDGSSSDQLFVESLRWMCLAVRSNPDRAGSSRTAGHQLKISKPSTPRQIKTPELEFLNVNLEPLQDFPPDSSSNSCMCWMQLFRTGIVAWHHVPRTWGRGLELSFEMMVHLSAVENYLPVSGGLILQGHFTALVPISRDQNNGNIQWHFERESPDSFLRPQTLKSLQKHWFKTQDCEILHQSKCFLGWFDEANILLGTRSLLKRRDKKMTWSTALKELHKTPHRKGFETGGQLGISVGPINITSQAIGTWLFHSNVQQFRPPQQYVQALALARRKVALVLDSASKQAWLVPMLSLALHMCHIYVQELDPEGLTDIIPYAAPSYDGGGASFGAMWSKGDLEIIGPETLSQLFLRINTNLLDTIQTRENPTRSYIYASELMDLIIQPGAGTPLRGVMVSESTDAWKSLTMKVDAVGVCANLGSAIEPVSRTGHCECSTLPEGHFFLAAHLRCLDELSKRAGSSISKVGNGYCQFGDNLFWSADNILWNNCIGASHPSVWESTDKIRNVLQSIRRKPKNQVRAEDSIVLRESVTDRGVVVFGVYEPAAPNKWLMEKLQLVRGPSASKSSSV
ncbi:hypothetical protein HD806DRAFT_220358 [Xylariaceae sp. AK1471]|nr:hypothetical protein HD806DRAFT_220358 [Xylariaceae sp. AK1471]